MNLFKNIPVATLTFKEFVLPNLPILIKKSQLVLILELIPFSSDPKTIASFSPINLLNISSFISLPSISAPKIQYLFFLRSLIELARFGTS